MSGGFERREFLKVLGVGGAGAAVTGMLDRRGGAPDSLRDVPPEEITPGVATWYASTCGECPSGCGIRVRTREGRAVMIEGNPDHPVSAGRALLARGLGACRDSIPRTGRCSQHRCARAADGFEPIGWDEALQLLASRLGRGGAVASS